MSDYLLEPKETLTDIANAIREKTGSTEAMTVSQMASLISGIETGGGTPTIGGHKVIFGQFTPADGATNYILETGITFAVAYNRLLYVVCWLDDMSVVSNYTNSNIVISIAKQTTNGPDNYTRSFIGYYTGTSAKCEIKTEYGISTSESGLGRINFNTYSLWSLRPELYNYMIVYDE